MKYTYLSLAALVTVFSTFQNDAKQYSWPSGKQEFVEHDAHIAIRTLSKQETAALFSGNGKQLTAKRSAIIPIEITIHNGGSHALMIDADCINLSQLSTEDILSLYRKKTTMRAVLIAVPLSIAALGIGVLGLGITLAECMFLTGAKVGLPAYLGYQALGITAGTGALIVGSSTLGNAASKSAQEYNTSIENQINRHMFEHRMLIEPQKTITGIVFVKQKEYRPEFDITLVNTRNTNQNFVSHVQLA